MSDKVADDLPSPITTVDVAASEEGKRCPFLTQASVCLVMYLVGDRHTKGFLNLLGVTVRKTKQQQQ